MLKRLPFERPTEHYDERIRDLDEKLCELLKQRKDISEGNPGFPPFAYIAKWAGSLDLYEDYLKAVFHILLREEQFKPMVEPAGFIKHIPMLKSVEREAYFYTLTAVRQYENASVITLNIDWDAVREDSSHNHRPRHFELDLGDEYHCRMDNGGSRSGHASYTFVVSPPLPDDLTGLQFVFREFDAPLKDKPIGTEIVFRKK